MWKNGPLFLLIALLCGMSLGLAPVSAQNEAASAYQVITPDNLHNLEELYTFTCEGDSWSSASSFFGTTFAYGCFYRYQVQRKPPVITAYSLTEDRELWQFTAPTNVSLYGMELLSDEMLLALYPSRIALFDAGKEIESPQGGTTVHSPVAVSPDRRYVALMDEKTEGDVDIVRVMTLPDFKLLEHEFTLPAGQYAPQIAFSSGEPGLLAIANSTQLIRIYAIESGALLMEVAETPLSSEFPNEVYDGIIFSPDATQLLVAECTMIQMGCWQVGITRIEVPSGEITGSATFEYESFDFVAFSPDSPNLLMNGHHQLELLDMETLTSTRIPLGDEEIFRMSNVSFHAEGTLISVYNYTETASYYRIYGIPLE